MNALLPPGLLAHLSAASLTPAWAEIRRRLERNGHQLTGTIQLSLDDDGADRLAGLLGRPVPPGVCRIRLGELDDALHSSAAGCGLVGTVAALTGSPLRNRPAERQTAQSDRRELWTHLDAELLAAGLADREWVPPWTDWLHSGGLLTRLGPELASTALTCAVATLAALLGGGTGAETGAGAGAGAGSAWRGADRPLAELASSVTGSAHGLDTGRPAAVLVLRALALALDVPPPRSASDRRRLWERAGVSTDAISGTLLTWGLRPPGPDRWSAMMRDRADLGLVTPLTALELQPQRLLHSTDEMVHACENPQVLQAVAASRLARPMLCTSGNPSAAGALVLARLAGQVRYHGDFDWPGIAIAGRVFALGARSWRFGAVDYRQAVARVPRSTRLSLTGRPEATAWDPALIVAMTELDTAVHEEAVLDLLLSDLAGSAE